MQSDLFACFSAYLEPAHSWSEIATIVACSAAVIGLLWKIAYDVHTVLKDRKAEKIGLEASEELRRRQEEADFDADVVLWFVEHPKLSRPAHELCGEFPSRTLQEIEDSLQRSLVNGDLIIANPGKTPTRYTLPSTQHPFLGRNPFLR